MSLAIEANNFELRPALVIFVRRDQFSGRPTKNSNVHLRIFLAKDDTIKLNRVSAIAIRLKLFSFPLKDNANDWFQN